MNMDMRIGSGHFFARHPELTLQLGKERAIISPLNISKWFQNFRTYIEQEVKDPDLLRDPSRLYNADESGFSLCSTTGKVIAYRGAPVVYNYGNSSKQQLTVLACVSAIGHYCPPMIVYPGQRFNYEPLDGFEDAHMGRSESGWMDSELFCHWLLTCFIPSLDSRSVKRPVILFIDGHSTHLSLDASDICVQNGIELYCLLEHSSHVMQPLDLRLFATLKQSWKEAVRAFHLENIGEFVTKRNFARVFRSAWEKSTSIELAVKGFMEAGLFPLCPERVTRSVKLEPSRMFVPSVSDVKSSSEVTTAAPGNTEASTADKVVDQDIPIADDVLEENNATTVLQHGILTTHNEHVNEKTATSAVSPPHNAKNGDTVILTTAVPSSDTPAVSNTQPIPLPSTSSTPDSPFSKYLKYPKIPQTKTKKKKIMPMPKAITGHEYRKIMLQKKQQKEQEEKEKALRKEERARNRLLKEELKKKKQEERKKAMMERRAKKAQKELEKAMASDSDDATEMVPGKCYKCERAYDSDIIECERCFRKFHIACVQAEMIDDIPFECQFC